MEKIMPDSVSPSLQGTEVNPSRKLSLSEDIRQKLLNANRFILTVGVGAIIILLFMLLPVKQSIVGLLEAVQAMGDFAPLVFIAAHTLCVIVCFPGTVIFELGAGLLFSFTWGVCCVVVSKTFGAALSFWLGRTLLRPWVEDRVRSYPKMKYIYAKVGEDQWKWVFLLRLSPVPSWVNNYGLALTPVSFLAFLVATVAGGFLTILQNVYVGTAVGSVAALVSNGVATPEAPVDSEDGTFGTLHYTKTALLMVGMLSTLLISHQVHKLVSAKIVDP